MATEMPRFSVSDDHGNEHAIANEIGRPAGRSTLTACRSETGGCSCNPAQQLPKRRVGSVINAPTDGHFFKFGSAAHQPRNSALPFVIVIV